MRLREIGIEPDILVCRTEYHLNSEIKIKIALFCNLEKNAVIESIDANTIYDVPLLMQKEELDKVVLRKLGLKDDTEVVLKEWKSFLKKLKNPKKTIEIGLVGKYTELKDAYKSISESTIHAGALLECKVQIRWIHAEEINKKNISKKLLGLNGVIVAPGFGDRGI